ncbi:uncharacterized protein [Cherax quadricarinatus]|uniref:uncharacterized protein isoform X2 n=1 Tax=Cherax quadricarinatus TaxID=27406 RepID=UPI002378ACB6|nr:uncharacterized protein LOC128700153 isoform X2 [Cherax quadricarinatus]
MDQQPESLLIPSVPMKLWERHTANRFLVNSYVVRSPAITTTVKMSAIKILLGSCLLLLLLLSAVCSAVPVSKGEARSNRTERQATLPNGLPPVRIAGGRAAHLPGVGALSSFSDPDSINTRNNPGGPRIIFGRRRNPWFG